MDIQKEGQYQFSQRPHTPWREIEILFAKKNGRIEVKRLADFHGGYKG